MINKLQSEDAALRDSLAKMGSMNEALSQDKTDLNAYILQVDHNFFFWGGGNISCILSHELCDQLEDEKALLHTQKREAEQEKMTIRDELVRLEQDRMELDSARITLRQSLQDTELTRVGMEAELQSLRAERLKLQEKVTQVQVLSVILINTTSFIDMT